MIINGVQYKNVPMTFNTVCKLEDYGVSIQDLESHMMSAARAYAALCMRKTLTASGEEIEQHVINGGSLADIMTPFSEEVEKSGFFQKLSATAKETAVVQAAEEQKKIGD